MDQQHLFIIIKDRLIIMRLKMQNAIIKNVNNILGYQKRKILG